jgi:hypothetical protein
MGLITHVAHHLVLMVMLGKQLGCEFHEDLEKAHLTSFMSAASEYFGI